MMASSHVMFGAICWSGYASARGFPLFPEQLAIAAVSSLLPDIDHPSSAFGRRVKILSVPISMIFGHRGITHSLFAVLACVLALAMWVGPAKWLIFPLIVGYLSHLIGDFFTNSGVPLLWPIKRKFALPVMSTNSFVEHLVLLVMFVVVSVMVYRGWMH